MNTCCFFRVSTTMWDGKHMRASMNQPPRKTKTISRKSWMWNKKFTKKNCSHKCFDECTQIKGCCFIWQCDTCSKRTLKCSHGERGYSSNGWDPVKKREQQWRVESQSLSPLLAHFWKQPREEWCQAASCHRPQRAACPTTWKVQEKHESSKCWEK